MIRTTAALLITLIASAAHAAPQQFDLICTGTRVTLDAEKPQPWSGRYRVDLKQQRFCNEECKSAAAIATITPDMITFSKHADTLDGVSTWHYISRQTGELVRSYSSRRPAFLSSVKAKCEIAPFSGLPKPLF